MWKLHNLAALIMLSLAAGCDGGRTSGLGFSLPAGDVKKGEVVFLSLQCNNCHVIVDNNAIKQPLKPPFSIPLGGKTTRIKTYGELVTSVINPSHELAKRIPARAVSADLKSKMPVYNEVMTVDELINLVSFLQSQYELDTYTNTRYRIYP